MINILKNSLALVEYDTVHKLIIITWYDKSFTFEEYKTPFERGLDYQKEKGIKLYNFISDVRNQKVVPPHFRKWFQEVAIQKAMNQGLRRAAVLMSSNVFKKYYINHIFKSTQKFGLPLKAFSSIEAAHKWFDSFGE